MSERRGRAVILTPEWPYPLNGGGAFRIAGLVDALRARHTLDLVVFHESGDPDRRGEQPAGLFERIAVIPIPRHSRSAWARAWRNADRARRGVSPMTDRFGGFAAQVAEALRGPYDLGVIEHFWCAAYVDVLAPRCRRVAIDLHNIESAYLRTLAGSSGLPPRWVYRHFAARATAEESRLLPKFDLALTASAEDRGRIAAHLPGDRIFVYPNSIPFAAPPEAPDAARVVFSGNLAYAPNQQAVRYFAREVWPKLRRLHPELEWRIVGRHPEAVAGWIRGLAGVTCTGPVDDAIAQLAGAAAAVVPLFAGSGTRIKILEAWAAGAPVVSTPLGIEGLGAEDGVQYLRAVNAGDFVAAVSRLLGEAGLRARVASAGRQFWTERYTWEAAAAALESLDWYSFPEQLPSFEQIY